MLTGLQFTAGRDPASASPDAASEVRWSALGNSFCWQLERLRGQVGSDHVDVGAVIKALASEAESWRAARTAPARNKPQ